jgi:hypothetical protein
MRPGIGGKKNSEMNTLHNLAEFTPLPENEGLVRHNGQTAYIRYYGHDGFKFHAAPFLSEWFDTFENCKSEAINYIFYRTDVLLLLKDLICSKVKEWKFTPSPGRLTIIIGETRIAVVDTSLKVIHATDEDVQCSVYGFIESILPYKVK